MSSEKSFLRRWLSGQVDWSAMLEEQPEAPKAAPGDPYQPHWDAADLCAVYGHVRRDHADERAG